MYNQDTVYIQVWRAPLEGAATPAQTEQKLDGVLVDRRKGKLPILKRTPKFADSADKYVAYYRQKGRTRGTDPELGDGWHAIFGGRRGS
jgi:hypothetical protein